MSDRGYLWLALVFYAISCLLSILRLRRSGPLPALRRFTAIAMICGVGLHTVFLFARGNSIGRCPLTNPFETTVFITWAAALFYILIGSSYRVSFLGEFTAPLVLIINFVALSELNDTLRPPPLQPVPWMVDAHKPISVLAFGAFALACVAGGMYLVQERQLKNRHLSPSFLLMPSIEQLDVINFRLMVLGFGMLTVGMIGGMISYRIVGHWTKPKIVWAVGVWLLYALVLLARRVWSLRGRKIALVSMFSFGFVLVTFWGVSMVSSVQGGPP
jgi:ABC-type transport system involved in cytochrome c biogenesis permease subunit